MTKESFQKFMDSQLAEIQKWKWIESENSHRDLGQEFCFNWIQKYSKKFYINWLKKNRKEL